jgi:predicted GIY-YIG superfamily endonuclease
MPKGYIYCISNKINSYQYVGKTIRNIQERFLEHCKDSQKEKCENRPLY